MVAIREHATETPKSKQPTLCSGTKQAMLIALLQRPAAATNDEIVQTTGWLAHTARGAMSGALGNQLGLAVTSAKQADKGRVYRVDPPAVWFFLSDGQSSRR